MTSIATVTKTRTNERNTKHVRHIITPDDPNVAYCGVRKPPAARRYTYEEVDELAICVVCLSHPGAREYAMGL